MRLERDVRQELVAELHAQGMSTRAIAPIVGVDNKTVHNDIKRIAGVENSTPEHPAPEPESYWSPEESFVGAHPITGEIIDAPVPLAYARDAYPPRVSRSPTPRCSRAEGSVVEVVALRRVFVGFLK
jgi:hypothetical protein